MHSKPNIASSNLLFASALISILLGTIASPIIGDEQQSWATLREPEYLAHDAPDAANLPSPPSTPDTGADWTSSTAFLNINAQFGDTTTEMFVPQQQENIPYLISDGMVEGTVSSPPEARGPPKPLRADLPGWDFRKYPGYPSEDSSVLYDPNTGMYWAQKKLACSSGKALYCCRPDDIKCCTFLSKWPQCIPSQQRCCDKIDKYENGENCSAAKGPGQVVPELIPSHGDLTEGSYERLPPPKQRR